MEETLVSGNQISPYIIIMTSTLIMFNWFHRLVNIFRKSSRPTWSAELYKRNNSNFYDAKYDGNNYNLKNRR